MPMPLHVAQNRHLLASNAPAGPTVLLSDTFTDTNGVNLTAHTMDVGGGWTQLTGTWTIQSNRASCTGAVDGYASANAGKADVTITAIINISDQYIGLIARWTTGSNGWLIYDQVGHNTLILGEVVNNALTTRATLSHSFATNTDHTITIVLSGSSITISADGGSGVTYNSATRNQTVPVHGLYSYSTPANRIDNYMVTG